MKSDRKIEAILEKLGIAQEDVTPLTGDASARRFFRLPLSGAEERPSAILIVFPEETDEEEIVRYALMDENLAAVRLPVPALDEVNPREGYIVAEDCGDELLQDSIRRRNPLPLYRQAIDMIVTMQQEVSPAVARLNPPFDEEKFAGELNFFLDHTIRGYLGAAISAEEQAAFRVFFLSVCREALAQEKVFCHRDYHSRNLLVQGARLRIVDFQDGRLGPYTYDLVSLLEDPYAELPAAPRDELKCYYLLRRFPRRGKNFPGDFQRDYDMMAVQRLLKAAGTYGYMAVEKGKDGYAKHIPAVFERVGEILTGYPELLGLKELLEKYAVFKAR